MLKMANENELAELLKCIYRLRFKTVKQIAEAADLHFTNLMDAMAGRRPVTAEKFEDLSRALGLINGMLISDQVHYWVVGLELNDLIVAVEKLFINGCEVAGIWRQGGKAFDIKRVFDKQMFLVYDDYQMVVVIRKRIGVHAPIAQSIGPEVLPNAKWRGGGVGAENMLSLPTDIFKKLELGEITDPDILKKWLGARSVVNWSDVLDHIKDRWCDPKSALDALLKIE